MRIGISFIIGNVRLHEALVQMRYLVICGLISVFDGDVVFDCGGFMPPNCE